MPYQGHTKYGTSSECGRCFALEKSIEKLKAEKTVALEDSYIGIILTFCENAAELGCPRDKEVDMWFRELPSEEQYTVVQKMMEIEERNSVDDGTKKRL